MHRQGNQQQGLTTPHPPTCTIPSASPSPEPAAHGQGLPYRGRPLCVHPPQVCIQNML